MRLRGKTHILELIEGWKMKKIKSHLFECVGQTPMVALSHYNQENQTHIFAKVEYFNPAGSVKDRVAKWMIDAAFKNHILKQGDTIIEPTSGNTGIGLACYGAILGCQVILTMPSSMSQERQNLLKAYGARVVLTPKEEGMAGAVLKAQSLANEIPNAIILGQFDNQNNVLAHYETTGPEIEDQMDHQIDFFIATIGTGGTISGVGKYLKEKNPHVQIIGVEPEGSPFLTKGKAGFHKIQGIGAGFQPSILDLSVIDQIVTVTDKEAYRYSQSLAKKEGLCVGISSGAAMAAAAKIAKQYPNKRIVVLFADSGERYLSTDLYREEI